jgi:hypothetical protein
MIHTINFSKANAAGVIDGTKKYTIRPVRKRAVQVGDTLRLYQGMRTKQCKLLQEVTCTAVIPIIIHDKALVMLDGNILNAAEIQSLARADGFKTRDEFFSYFWYQYQFPFAGVLIKWE